MKDRVPTPGQEGRVKITPEGGGATYYAKIEMADNPTQAGDEPIKANLLPDAVATVLGLTGNPQVKDALEKIKTLVDGNTTLASSKAKIATGSYVGTGTYGAENPCSLTFDFVPRLVVVCSASGIGMNGDGRFSDSYIWTFGTSSLIYQSSPSAYVHFSVFQKTLSWYADGSGGLHHAGVNTSGETYYFTAIG